LKMILQKEKVRLRLLEMADRKMLAELINNKKIWDNVRDSIPFPYFEQDAVSFINAVAESEVSDTFAIEYDGDFCGVIGLVFQKDIYRKSAEIGYWIGEPYWGKGIASLAVGLLTDYGFNRLHLVRIFAGVFEHNFASMRVLQKNGYTKEAVLKKAVIKNGIILDEHRFAKTI